MFLRKLFSRDVRHASDMVKHVLKILNAQRDLLSAQAVELVEGARLEVVRAMRAKVDPKELGKRVEALEKK